LQAHNYIASGTELRLAVLSGQVVNRGLTLALFAGRDGPINYDRVITARARARYHAIAPLVQCRGTHWIRLHGQGLFNYKHGNVIICILPILMIVIIAITQFQQLLNLTLRF